VTKIYYGKQQEFRQKEEIGETSQFSKVSTKMGFTQSLRNGQGKEEIHQAKKESTLEKKRHRRIKSFSFIYFNGFLNDNTMNIEKYNYTGNENIGFHATVTEEQAIYPPEFTRKEKFTAEKTVETYINRTKLVGLFTAGNSNCILIPKEATSREKDKLEEAGISFKVLDSPDNALGNLILANDKGAIISPKLDEMKEEIEEALEVPVKVGKIAGLQNPGVSGLVNSRGAVIHREASEEEAEKIKEALDLEDIDIGTINLGSPYTGSGGLATDDLVLVGENTSGPEIGRIDRTMK